KASVKPMIHLHSHFTSGMSPLSHLKAIEAGVDIIDTCLTPYAYRTSHAALEPFVMSLLGTNRDTGFDINALADINEILERDVLPKYKHLLDDTKVSVIDINVLLHQTPGGMLSNLVNQLKEMDALDKIDEVYKELPRVRKELGQIPLVTPTSQIVGTQTVNNVLFDTPNERYKMITAQVKDLCYGLYGKTSVAIDPEVQKKALKGYDRGETPITCRPAEVLAPELEKAKNEIKDLALDDEDLIIYALFPVTGKKYLLQKYGKEKVPDAVKPITLEDVAKQKEMVEKAKKGELVEKLKIKEVPEKSGNIRTFNVFVDGEYFEVGVDEVGGFPVITHAMPAPAAAGSASPVRSGAPLKSASPLPPPPPKPRTAPVASAAKPEPAKAAEPVGTGGTPIKAPMPGMIIRYEKKVGDAVDEGETVVVIEAMKMENALPAPVSGVIKAINSKSGDSVARGDVLAVIG
ncbi:MAG: carboxylase, partial [Desulfobacula sp. GWF2_41_7]